MFCIVLLASSLEMELSVAKLSLSRCGEFEFLVNGSNNFLLARISCSMFLTA